MWVNRLPKMNPAASIAFLFASDSIPASATTVMSVSRCAVMNACSVGSMVAVSALLPSNASTREREPGRVCQQSDLDLRLEAAFLGEPGFAEPVTSIVLEVERRHLIQDKA